MTALEGLERLEAPAVWHPGGEVPPQDVYLAFGKAELVIQHPDGAALAHWSLPAVNRRNPGEMPALYAADAEGVEHLEITEPEMVAALERVSAALARDSQRRPRASRVLAGVALVALLLAVVAAPPALRLTATQLAPQATRVAVGRAVRDALQLRFGAPCNRRAGQAALARLARRAAGPGVSVFVLPDLPVPALGLPGRQIVLSGRHLAEHDDPDVTAGDLIAARVARDAAPPFGAVLQEAGTWALVRLLATGEIPGAAVRRYVDRTTHAVEANPPNPALAHAFAEARLDPAPYATARGIRLAAAASDPTQPSLDDTSWQGLRGICDD